MDQHDVRLLQQIRGYPCVTILLPTHRTSPDNKQDRVRLSNLVTEASNRLLSEFKRRDVDPIIDRLERLINAIDLRYALDGLALFVNQSFARASMLPFPVKERVVIDETFATRDLVYALNHATRCWVLVLSEKPTRLFAGVNETLDEIQSEGFPLVHEGPGGSAALPGGFGVRKSAYRDERHRQFFRDVDSALKPFMADDPLPLVVVGVARYLAFFDEVSAHKGAIVGRVTGSHDKTSAHELSKLVWPLVVQHQAERREATLAELQRAVSEHKYASAMGEVWHLAHQGRAATLLVEEDFHYPARLDATGAHLIPADDPTATDVMDDAVDEVIETVLQKQGKVVFVEPGRLSDHQHIALILRY